MNRIKDTFRYNKKRRHYSYIFKLSGNYCLNLLLTTDPQSKHKKHNKVIVVKNIRLYKHPNKRSNVIVYIYKHRPYCDYLTSFSEKNLDWKWDINDKRKVKRMKKYKKYYTK